MKVAFIGNGAWGKAVASLVTKNQHEVTFLTNGQARTDRVLVLTLPTQAMRGALEKIIVSDDTIVVNCAKGIERKTHKLPFQIVRDVLGKNIDYYSLMGPSFAAEVLSQMPTIVNLGFTYKNGEIKVKKIFETDFFRVRETRGVEALELAAAFKNVYAIATGIAQGLGFGTNTRVKLMLLAMEEFSRLCKKLNYRFDETAMPGIFGDLILTCSSSESRNFTFGKLLVNFPATEALEKVGSTVEGYYTAASVDYFVDKVGAKLPLAQFVALVVRGGKTKQIKNSFANFVKNV